MHWSRLSAETWDRRGRRPRRQHRQADRYARHTGVVRRPFRRVGPLLAPLRLPNHAAGIAHRADRQILIPAPTAQQDGAGGIQVSDQRQSADGMAEDCAIERLVEQAPDHHAGMVAIAQDHLA